MQLLKRMIFMFLTCVLLVSGTVVAHAQSSKEALHSVEQELEQKANEKNSINQEIEKIKKDGPSVEDLNKVKETWRQQHEVNLKENNFWARQLLQSVELGTDLQNVLTYEQRIALLTPTDVKNAAIKYLDMKNYVQIVLNPEK